MKLSSLLRAHDHPSYKVLNGECFLAENDPEADLQQLRLFHDSSEFESS